jgi:hypothetical protein
MIFVDKRARYNTKGLVIVRLVEIDTGGDISYLLSLWLFDISIDDYVNEGSGAGRFKVTCLYSLLSFNQYKQLKHYLLACMGDEARGYGFSVSLGPKWT